MWLGVGGAYVAGAPGLKGFFNAYQARISRGSREELPVTTGSQLDLRVQQPHPDIS